MSHKIREYNTLLVVYAIEVLQSYLVLYKINTNVKLALV